MHQMTITIPGQPITKKNHQRILRKRDGTPFVAQSAQYKQYEELASWHIKRPEKPLEGPLCLRCVYYMPTRRKVDLCNLLATTCDVLVRCGVILDDHSGIVVSHDGSRVHYDKQNPRVEITIDQEVDICQNRSNFVGAV